MRADVGAAARPTRPGRRPGRPGPTRAGWRCPTGFCEAAGTTVSTDRYHFGREQAVESPADARTQHGDHGDSPLRRAVRRNDRSIGLGGSVGHFRRVSQMVTPLSRSPAPARMIATTSLREKFRSGTTSDAPGSTLRSGANSLVSPFGVTR